MRSMAAFVLALGMLLWDAGAGAQDLPCEEDPALARAAASLLASGEALSAGALSRALREADSDLPAAHSILVPEGDRARLERWIRELQERSDAPLRCGEAASGTRRLLVAGPGGGRLLRPEAGPERLLPRLGAGFVDPLILLEDRTGRIERRHLEEEDFDRGLRISEELLPPIRVQLLATGARGPRPVAERVLGARVAAPPRPLPAGATRSTPAFIRALRASEGAPGLRRNRLLDAEAERHARHVCAAAQVSHHSARGDDPEARLARRGIQARLVGEAVARAQSAPEALEAIASSPSHRLAVLDPRFTDVGHALARDARGTRCVVILLAAWPRRVGLLGR